MCSEKIRHSCAGYGPSLRQLLTEPIENLRLLGRRAVLALLGIAVGCMAVVAVLNIGHNARIQAMSVFKGMGSDLFVASVQLPTGAGIETTTSIVTLDMNALNRVMPGISSAVPLIPVSMEPRLKGKILNATVLGSNSGLADTLDLQLERGRFLSRYDTQNTYAVVGANVATEWRNAGVQVATGDRIEIGNYLFEIIGILEKKGENTLLPVSADNSILLPIEGMRRIIPHPQISTVLARYPGQFEQEHNAQQFRLWLMTQLPGFDVNVQIPQLLLDGMARQSRLFELLLAGLGGIALLSGGIGVMNVMVMNISERRREIGVRMALGARPVDIASLFLSEAVVLATTGAFTGAGAGILLSWLFIHYSGWPSFSLSVISLPLGIGSAIITALFFGLSPAIAASRLSPVQALRDE
ncbi:ABC transporter permease [Salmonella enterica subsp. enterica serovar Newport]|nr:ABC transporter permease [Salmonella enterica subsp. enterica serovar Newport]